MDASTATNSSGELPPEEVSEVVSTWVDVLKIPTVVDAHFSESKDLIQITATWNTNDTAMKEGVKFQQVYTFSKASLVWKEGETFLDSERLGVQASMATTVTGKLCAISKDQKRKAVLMEKASKDGGNGKPTQFIEIWDNSRLMKSYDLSELDKHQQVYTGGDIGTMMVWNPAGNKLAYLAEKKQSKPKPFFTSDVCLDDDNSAETKPSGPKGEEYALKQSWGEQMTDMHFSVIVICDIATNKFKIIELPEDEFPTDLQWIGDSSVLGTSYKITNWRLGLIYCTNRESRIFKIDTNGQNLKFISAAGRAAFCPRVRPDGRVVVWQERAVDKPHRRAASIMVANLEENDPTPTCVYESVPPNLPIYEPFPRYCWTNCGSAFFVISEIDGVLSLISMKLAEGKLLPDVVLNTSPSVDRILCMSDSYMLIARSSITSSPYLELVEMSEKRRRVVVTKSEAMTSHIKSTSKTLFGKASIPSFLVYPEGSSPHSVPLVVWVHGGPHSCFVDSFMHESTLLARLGFAFLKVNYIGSTGANKRDETDDLLGHVGTLDVLDSQEIVEQAVANFPCIDPQRIGVWGGSHGGFLTCHLISQFPDFYKAGVARNPVVDLTTMIGTSDITDWVYAETGFSFPPKPSMPFIPAVQNADQSEELLKRSPIFHVSKVKAATLLCVGTEDLRVPDAQGLAFYRALKAYGKTAEVRVYPDCHPLSKVPVRLDNVIHAALWFRKFIK